MRRIRGHATAAGLLAGCVALSGCGLVSGPVPLSADAPLVMEVSSPAVSAKGLLPATFTCHGRGVSPPVSWSGAPRRTRSFALVLDDADAPIAPYVYWLVTNISNQTTDIQQHNLPPQARVADNSAGRAGYDPPCPGSAAHRYRITVYALDVARLPRLPNGPQLLDTWTAIAPHVLARGTLTVTACPGQGLGC